MYSHSRLSFQSQLCLFLIFNIIISKFNICRILQWNNINIWPNIAMCLFSICNYLKPTNTQISSWISDTSRVSRNSVAGLSTNMKSTWFPLTAIFFLTYYHRNGTATQSSWSATDFYFYSVCHFYRCFKIISLSSNLKAGIHKTATWLVNVRIFFDFVFPNHTILVSSI